MDTRDTGRLYLVYSLYRMCINVFEPCGIGGTMYHYHAKQRQKTKKKIEKKENQKDRDVILCFYPIPFFYFNLKHGNRGSD